MRCVRASPGRLPLRDEISREGSSAQLRRLAREIELLVPAGWRVDAQLGQRVRSGETLLATMLRKT